MLKNVRKKLFIGAVNLHRISIPTWFSKIYRLTPASSVASTWMVLGHAFRGYKSNPTHARLGSRLAFLLLVLVSANDALAQVQIVSCDAQVQSRKRGIAVNTMSAADFQAVGPGVSWFYDWGVNNWSVPTNVSMGYIPMAWNGNSGFQTSLSSYLAAGNRPWRVFAINEPNLKGQAYMTPSNTAVAFKQVKAICDPYNIPVICPHMAEGTAASNSITAYDPIQGSNVTYTSAEPFLQAFFNYCTSNTPAAPAGISDHSYGGYGDLTYWTGLMHSDFPTQTVWVTEFNASASSDAAAIANLIPSVDYCERTPWIEGYSWFMARISGNPYNSLLTSSSGVLTPAGQAYVQMPVHDTNLFYRIPGRLQAERYVTMINMNIAATTDTNGLADMISAAAGGNLYYNIQVDTAGSYPLNFRVSGATGQISVYEGSTLLGTANIPTATWSTVSTTVTLPAGTQTLKVVLSANAQQLNWMEFQPVNGPVAVPTGVSATATNTQVTLSWSPAAGATSYNVQSSTTQGGPYTTIASPTTTSYTNTGLTIGTTYYYVVSATDGINVSSNSIEVSATTGSHVNLALNQPVTVSSIESGGLYPGNDAVDGNLSTRWSSSFSDPQWIYVDLGKSYNITEVVFYWNTSYAKSFLLQVSSDTTNWTSIYSTTTGPGGVQDLTGLSGTGRYVRMYGTVRSLTYGYSIYEFQIYGNIPAPPTPTGLMATAGNAQVALSWNASSGATSYNVKSSTTNGGPYVTIASPTTTGYTNTSLLNGTTYYYVVSAVGSGSESTNSSQVSATPVCTPPATPTAGNNGPILAGATLNLTASTVSGATYSWTGPNGFTSASQNPSIVNATTDATGTYSVTATVGGCTSSAGTTAVVVNLIPTPTGLTATASNSLVTLSWNPSTAATGYNLKRSLIDGGPYTLLSGGLTDTNYSDSAVTNGTTYYYVVSASNNVCESTNSSQVSAMPTNLPPVLAAIPNQSILAGQTLLVTNSASDPNTPPLPLAFSLLNPPVGASIDTNSGLFTWRPAIAQSPSTPTVSVVVADNGAPPLTATQSFTITVNQPVVPTLSAAHISNGQFGFWINGSTGPDYTIQKSTNLISWIPLSTSNSPSLPYFWTDTNAMSNPSLFYRVLLGP